MNYIEEQISKIASRQIDVDDSEGPRLGMWGFRNDEELNNMIIHLEHDLNNEGAQRGPTVHSDRFDMCSWEVIYPEYNIIITKYSFGSDSADRENKVTYRLKHADFKKYVETFNKGLGFI